MNARDRRRGIATSLDNAERCLSDARGFIEAAEWLLNTDHADMLGCFASNVLEGSRSLIREMRALARTTKRRSKP